MAQTTSIYAHLSRDSSCGGCASVDVCHYDWAAPIPSDGGDLTSSTLICTKFRADRIESARLSNGFARRRRRGAQCDCCVAPSSGSGSQRD